MTNPKKQSNLISWKWTLIGAGSTVLLAIDGLGFSNLINPKIFSTSVATAIPQNSVAKKLIGQWQGQISGQSLTLIFTPEGKLFILNSPTSALEMEYKINVNPQPKHLDILVGGQITSRTIFDFTTDGQLRLQLGNTIDNQPRPYSFSDNASLLKKISARTTLPANVTVMNVQAQVNKAKQSEAKQYISSMNKGQQAFYAENSRFAARIEKLPVIGIKSETENYSYSIVLSNDNRWVQAIALAKTEGLNNYTGIVVSGKTASGQSTTEHILCESNQPSIKLPEKPTATNLSNIKCPPGYSEVSR
ncbi:type IV pilin-like G/H family protein [Microcoleus sp. D2_18a_D3]|uniref:type IV pilin-like G/H family protein n=1 Tax=Microcoleus sp. D2_18a_D3 TaxID=3055330 RepID=UPI002FD423A0